MSIALQLGPPLFSNSCVRSLSGFGAGDARELAGSDRRRLVGGGGVAVEHQGVRAHPWRGSTQQGLARGVLAMSASCGRLWRPSVG